MQTPHLKMKRVCFAVSARSQLLFSGTRLTSLSTLLFYGVIALLAAIAAMRLYIGFEVLTCWWPLDLETRYSHVHYWFSGSEFYASNSSTYPPASYLILWPILGWLPFEAVRTLWTLLLLGALIWLTKWCLRADDGRSRAVQCFIGVVFLAMSATGGAIEVGQLTPFLLVLIITALSLVSSPRSENGSWRHGMVAAILMTAALVKPSVTAPFLWLVLWRPARLRVGIGVVLAVVVGYAALTLLSLSFQHNGVKEISDWAAIVSRNNAEISEGYANLRDWMASAGLKPWSHPASLLVIGCLGFWTYRYRHLDEWLLLGVVGLVARMWTYHSTYDDMLMIFAVLALLHIARQTTKLPDSVPKRIHVPHRLKNPSQQAQILLGILVFTLIVPAHLMQTDPTRAVIIWHGFQSIVWLLTLAFLLSFAKRLSPETRPLKAIK